MMMAEEVGVVKENRGSVRVTVSMWGDQLEFSVGGSSLVLKADGTIVLSGKKLQILGSTVVDIIGEDVNINPSGASPAVTSAGNSNSTNTNNSNSEPKRA